MRRGEETRLSPNTSMVKSRSVTSPSSKIMYSPELYFLNSSTPTITSRPTTMKIMKKTHPKFCLAQFSLMHEQSLKVT